MSTQSITKNRRDVNPPALEDHLDLVRKIVWRFARKYELDFDDLFQEACLSCVQALPKYNPERGSFSTFLWHTATNALNDLISKNRTFDHHHYLTEDFSLQEDVESTSADDVLLAEERFQELWNALSPEAQEICHMVIADQDIYRQTSAGNYRRKAYLPTDRPRRSRAVIRDVLIQKGWKKARIHEAFNEIKTLLGTT